MRLLDLKYICLFFLLTSCTVYHNKQYYFWVNKAEKAIASGQYQIAKKRYKKAFVHNEGFANHYFNALKLSIMCNDIHFAEFNTVRLLERGICTDFFDNYPQIKNNSEAWNRLIACKREIDSQYYGAIQSMTDLDQSIGRKDKDSTKIVFMHNFVKFKTFVKEKGYPTELKIGLECTPNKMGFYVPPQNILLFHFAQFKFEGVDTLLNNALKNREIEAFKYAEIIEKNSNYCQYCTEPLFLFNGLLYTPKSCSNKKSINKFRKKIGLPTVEHEIKIINFKIQNPNHGFRLNGNICILEDIPPDVLKKLFNLYH